jgi:tetratricopeptide (TPR) repeat protein
MQLNCLNGFKYKVQCLICLSFLKITKYKMKKIIFLLVFFAPIYLFSQANDGYNSGGQNDDGHQQIQYNVTENLVYTEDFSGAIKMYKQMISFDPKNPAFYYKLGFSYLNTFGKQDSALIFLQKADKLYSSKYRADVSPTEIKFYLARAYRLNDNIDSSIILLESLRLEVHNEQFLSSVNAELQKTRNQLNSLFTVTDLDSVINSSYSDHSPVYSNMENILIFTSRRKNPNSTKYDDGQYDEDIYYSEIIEGKWSSPKLMTNFSGPDNEATASIATDGKNLLIYKDEDDGSIYLSKFINGNWSVPEKMPKPINTRHRETHASLTEDGTTMFFTSDRLGGYGGLDIWMSIKLGANEWSKPINLGESVNSKGDEESPNISDDGKTLYFSSNGRINSFGGFDIYKSEKTEFNTWGIAENLGYPINSIGDDIFFTPINSTEKAFYTSYRYGSHGNADIFVVYLDSTDINKQTVNFGFVYDENDEPVNNVEIYITNTKTQEKKIARPAKSGKFIFVTEANNTYALEVNLNDTIVFSDTFSFPDSVPRKKFYKKIIVNSN